MKAEERHEMRENDLANWLQYGLWAFLKQNGSYILLILALAFLGYQYWNYRKQSQVNARYAAYAELSGATSPEALDTLIANSEFKSVKAQACLRMGLMYGQSAANPEALDQMKMSRPAALSKAYDYFTKALEFQGEDPLINSKAHIGIAGVYEDQGEWDKAKAEYQLIIDNKLFAGSPVIELAKDRLATLPDRRDTPRLAAMIPVKSAATSPTFQIPGITPRPGSLLNPGAVGTAPSSGFQGLMLGPPAPAATTNPSRGLSPFGGTPVAPPGAPATAP